MSGYDIDRLIKSNLKAILPKLLDEFHHRYILNYLTNKGIFNESLLS
jgi:hypothetical protein